MDGTQQPAALSKAAQNTGFVISLLALTLIFIYLSFGILGLKSEPAIVSSIGLSFVCAAGLCLFALIRYRRAHQPLVIDYLNVGTQRYVLAVLMALYGIDKLLGNFFDYQLFALDSKLADVSEFQLAWFFYGKNHWQELFTGIMEFVPGILLFSRRSYYVAALILLPVTAQVFLLNFFFRIGGITLPAATVLLACNLYILYSQKGKIILFFKSLRFNTIGLLTGRARAVVRVLRGLGIGLALMLVLLKLRPVVFKSAYQRMYQGLVGVYSLKEVKKNGRAFTPLNDSAYYRDLYIEKQDRWNILRRGDNQTEAFILKLNRHNDSLSLYINKGGTGDGADLPDTVTALKGVYRLQGKYLTIKGIRMNDTLELTYERQEHIRPKKWLW